MGQDGGVPTVILRSLLGRVGVVLILVCALYVTVTIWLSDGYRHGLQALAVCACVVAAVWLLWWRPQAVLAQEALTVRNSWRTHVLDWETLRAAPTRWALAVEAPAAGAGTDDARARSTTARGGARHGTGSAEPRRVTVSACQRGGVLGQMRHERRGSGARDEYVAASQDLHAAAPVYRTHLDAADGAYLIDLYQATRAENEHVLARLRRRERRLGHEVTAGATAAQPEEQPRVSVTSRWDVTPVVIVAAVAVAVVLTTAIL